MTCGSLDIACRLAEQLNINTSGLNALFWVLIIFFMYFVIFRIWPFYVQHVYPDRLKLEEDKNKNLKLLEDNLVKLTILVEKIDLRGSGFSFKFDEVVEKLNWLEDQWNQFNQDRKSEAYYHRFDSGYFKDLKQQQPPGSNRESIYDIPKDKVKD